MCFGLQVTSILDRFDVLKKGLGFRVGDLGFRV